MKKIGFIGLGNMGSKMVLNLLNAKYEVLGYDINDESVDKLVEFGMKKAETLLDISQEIEIVITMLPNGDEVKRVFESIKKNLNPNTLFVDCSTINVSDAQEIHQKCLDNNLLCLDAPVSGGVNGAKEGTLTFMIGGTKEAFDLMGPVFDILGNKSVLCGLAGSGQAAKACNNMLLAITMIGVGESFNLGMNLGLDPEKLFEILSTSSGYCWAVNNYCPIKDVGPNSPADNDFKPGFSADLMLKDLTIALEAIKRTGSKANFGIKAQENFQNMIKNQTGHLDFSAIVNFNNENNS